MRSSRYAEVELGDVCKIAKRRHSGDARPYVGMDLIESGTGRLVAEPEVAEVGSATFDFEPTHLLYGRLRPYLNKVLLPDFSGHCSSEIFPLACEPELSRGYLSYWLRSDATVAAINATATGTRMPRADVKEMLRFSIPLPPLAEQKRIVAVLDEAFAAIDAASVSIVRHNREAESLLEQASLAAFDAVCDGAEMLKLGDCASFRNGLNFSTASRGSSVRLVGVSDFAENDIAPLAECDTAILDGELAEADRLEADDLLVVRSNGSKHLVGRCMLVPELDEPTSWSGFVIRVRCSTPDVLPAYLLRYFKLRATRDALTREGGGSSISNINQRKLSALDVPVPPVEKQAEVVKQITFLKSLIEDRMAVAEAKAAAIIELRRSLLHRAFTGRLTAEGGAT